MTVAGSQPSVAFAQAVYHCVCRDTFENPGFCLIDLGSSSSSHLRQSMLDLKRLMQPIHRSRTGRDLAFLSAARFDQQVTTKFHRDGGPDECFLMLGYEPSSVPSEVSLADYSRCSFDMGLTPKEFLEKRNPMYVKEERLLVPYTTSVRCFSNHSYQVVLINNSIASFSQVDHSWQGVLHKATISNPNESMRRVVNSMMVASVEFGTSEAVSEEEQVEFVKTTAVRRAGYDKPDLEDDQ